MFLINTIKHNVEKNFYTGLFWGVESVQNKTSLVSFRFMISGGNKNFIQNKRENLIIIK